MAGRTLAAVRNRTVKAGRHYAWVIRAIVCLSAIAFRHPADLLFIAAWVIAAGAFSAGLWLALHQKPPEDLSHDIVPHDS